MVDSTQILNILPKRIRNLPQITNIDFPHLREIRIRIGQTVRLYCKRDEIIISDLESPLIEVTDIKEIMEYVSRYSLFAYEHEMKQGYITIRGGHRVGIVGKTIIEDNKVKNIKNISSVNIRVAHEVVGCGDLVYSYIAKENQFFHTLIISPPGCGKTTLLRDLIRLTSSGSEQVKGVTVGVVDERSEIGGCYQGIPQNDLGERTDVLDGCPKREGMLLLIRSMSPVVLAVDEIGGEDEIQAMKYAMNCGCKILTTIHGTSLDEIMRKPQLKMMIKEQLFERYVVLSNQIGQVERIYNERGHILHENSR